MTTRYRLRYAPEIGEFEYLSLAILAGILSGLTGDLLEWVAIR